MKKLLALALIFSGVQAFGANALSTAQNVKSLVMMIGGTGVTNTKYFTYYAAAPTNNYYTYNYQFLYTNLPAWCTIDSTTRYSSTLKFTLTDALSGTIQTNISVAVVGPDTTILRTNLSFRVRGATPTTNYVATTGNDTTGDGSIGNPWATMTKAESVMVPGDKCIVSPGKYNERVTVNLSTNSPDYTTFMTNGASALSFNSMTNLSMAATECLGFELTTDHNIIQGFGVTNTAAAGVNLIAIRCVGNEQIVQNNFPHDNPGRQYGLSAYIYDHSYNNLIRSNTVFKCQTGIVGWWFNTYCTNNEVLRLVKTTTGDDADYCLMFMDGNHYLYNFLHGSYTNELFSGSWAHVDGFQTYDDPNYWTGTNEVAFNIIQDCHEGMIFEQRILQDRVCPGTTNVVQVHHNVFGPGLPNPTTGSTNGVRPIIVHDMAGVTATNNTAFNWKSYFIDFTASQTNNPPTIFPKIPTNGMVFNNLCYNVQGGYKWTNSGGMTSGYNAMFQNNGLSYETGLTSPVASDIVGTDPQFVDVNDIVGPDRIPWTPDDGLRLGAGNALRTAGQGGIQIGAYEGLTPPAPPTDYYVSTSGNNGNDGSILTPWRDIQYAVDNALANTTINVAAGTYVENVLISRTNLTVKGTMDGTHWDTLIDPSTVISSWTAATEIGPGVYKKTGLAFETKEMEINGSRVAYIQTTNDITAAMNYAYTASGISNGVQLLTSSTNLTLVSAFTGQSIRFWDSIYALWASTNGTTYLRLWDKSDPSSLSIRVSGNLDGSWTDDAWKRAIAVNANNTTIKNISLKGAWAQAFVAWGSSNVVLDTVAMTGGRYRFFGNIATNVVATNCLATTSFYGNPDPGAWQGLTTTGNRENLFLVAKFLMGGTFVSDTGFWIRGVNGMSVRNCTFLRNIGDNIVVGDYDYPVQNITISSNSFANSSSHGVFTIPGQTNTQVMGNTFSDLNVHVRFQSLDYGDARTIKVYRNIMWNPAGAGEGFYGHYNDTPQSVYPLIWVYNNSISGGFTGIDTTPNTATAMNGVVFVNNIFSGAPWLTTYSMAFMTNANRVGAFDYNLITPPAVTYPTTNSPAWWGSNNKIATAPVWSTNSVPDFVLPNTSQAIGNALDVTQAFTLRGTNYSALPNTAITKVGRNWDIGALESDIQDTVININVMIILNLQGR